MDLHTPQPYSFIKHGFLGNYPTLGKNTKAEVAIIGAGITGALIGWHLAQEGVQCVLVDKRHAGAGSTAASTSLIQYEIDTPLHKLIEKTGKEKAVKSYKLCLEAIYDLEKICDNLDGKNTFMRRCSLQYASHKKDVKSLLKEYELRKEAGFDVELLIESAIKKDFGFTKPAALLSKDAAQVDAYYLTHQLLQGIQKMESSVYDSTKVVSIDHKKNGVRLKTEEGFYIDAKKLVVACGYESQQYLSKKVEDIFATYVIMSEALNKKEIWKDNCLIWETAEPYLYMRTTREGRILVGGKDSKYKSAQHFSLLNKKAISLKQSFQKLFPDIPFKTDFKWAGAFGTTKDGLPYIGAVPEKPNTYFALGYGGNGITFSVLAAQYIRDWIKGKNNTDASIFSFNR